MVTPLIVIVPLTVSMVPAVGRSPAAKATVARDKIIIIAKTKEIIFFIVSISFHNNRFFK